MAKAPDFSPTVFPGQQYARLTVNGDCGRDNHNRRMYHCTCSCGKTKVVAGFNLTSGNTKSCGCYGREQKEVGRAQRWATNPWRTHYVHGHSNPPSPTFSSWSSMLSRCHNPNQREFHYWGGRGVTVCDRWREPKGQGFLSFLKDMGERPEGRTLDRIDPSGNYEPANCRWATPKEQANNRRPRQPK